MAEKIYKFTDPVKAGSALLMFLKISLAVSLAGFVSNIYEIRVLKKIGNGAFYSEEEMFRTANFSDTFATITGVGEMVVSLVVIVLFFCWLYRSAANVQTWRIGNVSQKPHWGFWNFIIPVWSLYKPYIFIRELWNSVEYSAEEPERWKNLSGPACLKVWWALYLITSILDRTLFKYSLKADDRLETVLAIDYSWVVSDLLAFVETIALILIVSGITMRQKSYQAQLPTAIEP